MSYRILTSKEADALGPRGKWDLLSPFLTRYGREALSYATLQNGMEYFLNDCGYIAFTTVVHPVLARKARRITFADPVCALEDYPRIITEFLSTNRRAAFGVVSEACGRVLRDEGFKVNCVGYEPELSIQTYNTKGDWKQLDLIKRARNEARREGITILEEQIDKVDRKALEAVTSTWMSTKRLNDREIWLYARRPCFEPEPGVRKFLAYDRDRKPAGFVFYDPMYRDGRVFGYSANVTRCDERRFGRLNTAIHMAAMDVFRAEGAEILNLCLAPFVDLDSGTFNDDPGSRWFFKLSAGYGNNIYNFQGLAFHKSKYRGNQKYLYYASNNLVPTNDIYLAFKHADIARGYLATFAQLVWGIVSGTGRGAAH